MASADRMIPRPGGPGPVAPESVQHQQAHASTTGAVGKQLGGLAAATKLIGRQRSGLNSSDLAKMTGFIKAEVPWPKIKEAMSDIADASLEGWKEEAYRRVRDSGKPRLSDSPTSMPKE